MATEQTKERESGKWAVIAGGAILVLLSLFWMSGSYLTIEEEFSAIDKRNIFSIILLVLVVEIAIMAGAFAVTRKSLLPALLCALFIVANAFSLNLVMNAAFMTLHPAAIAGIVAAGIFIAYAIVNMAAESRMLRRAILAILVLLAVSPFITIFSHETQAMPPHADNIATPAGNVSRIVRNVDFIRKPNVYFIGFESMAPQAVLSKYLGYDSSPLLEAIRDEDFRVFRNLFAERVATRNALSSLLALDAEYYASDRRVPFHIFSGSLRSPLLEVFKHNGYETNTSYGSAYMGSKAGPYVDHYRFNAAFSVCTFMEPHETAYAFFGACRLYERTNWRDAGKFAGSAFDFMLSQIAQISKQPQPQFLLAHHHPPIHSRTDFIGTQEEIEQLRDSYHKASIVAAEHLRRLKVFIAENDPEALLFVFGDHGIYLSRKSDDLTFVVQDTHAVAGGVYPRDACAESFDNPISEDFTTVPQVARMIIRCLAGGVDAFDPSYEHRLVVGDRDLRFEDFLYE